MYHLAMSEENPTREKKTWQQHQYQVDLNENGARIILNRSGYGMASDANPRCACRDLNCTTTRKPTHGDDYEDRKGGDDDNT